MPDTPVDQSELMDIDLLDAALAKAKTYEELKQAIVNAPFEQKMAVTFQFLGFITLLTVNQKTKVIDRIALSNTDLAGNTLVVSYVPFEDIKIPVEHRDNIIARAIRDKKPYDTTDWYYTFTPALTAEQARLNQASGGIAYTAVYPLDFENGGVISFSFYQYAENIGATQRAFMDKYSKIVSRHMADKFVE